MKNRKIIEPLNRLIDRIISYFYLFNVRCCVIRIIFHMRRHIQKTITHSPDAIKFSKKKKKNHKTAQAHKISPLHVDIPKSLAYQYVLGFDKNQWRQQSPSNIYF